MWDNDKILVRYGDFGDYVKIVPLTRSPDGMKGYISVPDGTGKWERLEFSFGEYFEPDRILAIPYSWAKQLYEGLKDIFEPSLDATTEELKATKYHLEDMRHLVFKDKLKGADVD